MATSWPWRTWGNSYGCDFYTFSFMGGLHSSQPRGGSCSVLYSDLLGAIGMPVP